MRRAALMVLALGACTDQAIIDGAFPDRQKFSFASRDAESVFTYTCAPATTEDATKLRAAEAHTYLDKRFTSAVDRAAEQLAAAKDGQRTRAIGRALDAEVEDIVEQTEERFECLFIQGRNA